MDALAEFERSRIRERLIANLDKPIPFVDQADNLREQGLEPLEQRPAANIPDAQPHNDRGFLTLL